MFVVVEVMGELRWVARVVVGRQFSMGDIEIRALEV